MTREEAKQWFEMALAGEMKTGGGIRPAYERALEALSQPKFIALKQGEVAVLEVEQPLSDAQYVNLREHWEKATGTKAVVLDKSVRLVGRVESSSPSNPKG